MCSAPHEGSIGKGVSWSTDSVYTGESSPGGTQPLGRHSRANQSLRVNFKSMRPGRGTSWTTTSGSTTTSRGFYGLQLPSGSTFVWGHVTRLDQLLLYPLNCYQI